MAESKASHGPSPRGVGLGRREVLKRGAIQIQHSRDDCSAVLCRAREGGVLDRALSDMMRYGPRMPSFTILAARPRDLGGFGVRRTLPSVQRRMVGPFIFWDHMGPARFEPGNGIDVRPHPHINLATVTYLFEGEIVHKDSLGSDQAIAPGDVNWMTAGRGIVHSERTGAERRKAGGPVHGIQSWVALPSEVEETEPAFQHVDRKLLPELERIGARLRVIAGTAFGATAGCGPRDGSCDSRARALSGDALGRRAHGQALHLVELRIELGRAHRARKAGLEGASFPERAGRRCGVRPSAGVAAAMSCGRAGNSNESIRLPNRAKRSASRSIMPLLRPFPSQPSAVQT